LNSEKVRQRADESTTRLETRLTELERERQQAPLSPVVIGGALVVPAGLLARLRGEQSESGHHADETQRME
jgi:hypothetical protein